MRVVFPMLLVLGRLSYGASPRELEGRSHLLGAPKPAKFSVVSVSPTTLSTRGREEVVVQVNDTLIDPVFCRFGAMIVMGRQLANNSIVCVSPPLPQGELLLSLSMDKAKWCRDVVLSVVADDSNISWGMSAIGFGAVVAVLVLVTRMLCTRRRIPKRRKAARKKRAGVDPSSAKDETAKLHRRKNPDPTLL
jgi:hypothetical protein